MAIVIPNWLPNFAAMETTQPPVPDGYSYLDWAFAPSGSGRQPESAGNPDGQFKAGSIAGMTAAALAALTARYDVPGL
jgi:hypothetical protein